MKLKDAIQAIESRQSEAHRMELARKRDALSVIAPIIALIKDTFEEDDLKGWDAPTYCSGVAFTRFWLEGRYGSVYLNVDSRFPERVVVCRENGELSVNTFPATEDGLAHMVASVAERITLSVGKLMITAS